MDLVSVNDALRLRDPVWLGDRWWFLREHRSAWDWQGHSACVVCTFASDIADDLKVTMRDVAGLVPFEAQGKSGWRFVTRKEADEMENSIKPFWIVIRGDAYGRPAPMQSGTQPVRFDTESEAICAAETASTKDPGYTFVTYRSVASSRCANTVTTRIP